MKNCFKWIFDVALLVMIALAFIWSQSLALKAVTLWAWFGIVVSVLLIVVTVISQCLWLKGRETGIAPLVYRTLRLDKEITLWQQFRFVISLSLTSACLLYGDLEFVALGYLAALLGFRFLRSVFLMLMETTPCYDYSV